MGNADQFLKVIVLPFPENHPKTAPFPSSFFQGDPWLTPFWGDIHSAQVPLKKTAPRKQNTLLISPFHLLTPKT